MIEYSLKNILSELKERSEKEAMLDRVVNCLIGRDIYPRKMTAGFTFAASLPTRRTSAAGNELPVTFSRVAHPADRAGYAAHVQISHLFPPRE